MLTAVSVVTSIYCQQENLIGNVIIYIVILLQNY